MPGATDPVRTEVRIAAPPEVVFPCFTDQAKVARGERTPHFTADAHLPN